MSFDFICAVTNNLVLFVVTEKAKLRDLFQCGSHLCVLCLNGLFILKSTFSSYWDDIYKDTSTNLRMSF